jgi:hypothetical protein
MRLRHIAAFASFISLLLFSPAQFFGWEWEEIPGPLPVVGEPVTSIVSGPAEDSVERTASSPFDFSGGNTYQCREKNGSVFTAWTTCSDPYDPTWDNDYQVFQVRAVSILGQVDTTEETRSWTNFICSGTQVTPASNIETVIESAATGATICIEAGDYEVNGTITVGNGKDLFGQPGPTFTPSSVATGAVEVPIPSYTDYPVDIDDGSLSQVVNTSGCTPVAGELPQILALGGDGNNIIQWIGFGGADSEVSVSSHCSDGSGTGISLGGGETPQVRWSWGHDNGLQAINTNNGSIHNNFFGPDNGIEEEALGFGGGVGKTTQEYEFYENFSFRNPGNGQWCDHSAAFNTANQTQYVGCHVHNNFFVQNGRWGFRYEYTPRQVPPFSVTSPYQSNCTVGGATDNNGTVASVTENQDIPENPAGGPKSTTSCHHYPQSDENFDHDDFLAGVYVNNVITQNGSGGGSAEGGFSVQAAQNALVKDNMCGQITIDEIPDSMIGSEPSRPNEWSEYGLLAADRTFSNNASNKCGQAFNSAVGSDQQTDLWNADFYSNDLNGEDGGNTETLGGCSNANNIVYCFGNIPSTGDDTPVDTNNDWDAADMP